MKQQKNGLLSEKDNSNQKAEDVLAMQNESLTQLNHFAVELAMLSSDDNLEALITRWLKKISGAEVVIFSEYNPESRTTTIRSVEIEQDLLKKVVKLLGRKIFDIHSVVSEEMYREMTSQAVGMRDSLYEMAMGSIPFKVSATIQVLLRVDRFFGLAFVIEGKLYGASILGMKRGKPNVPIEILENLVSLVAVSLRRKKAEKALKEKDDLLQTIYDQNSIATYIVKVVGEGKYEYEGINRTYENLFGITNDAMAGKRPDEMVYFFGAEAIKYANIAYNTCVETKAIHESEFEVILQNGIKDWWLTRISPLIDDHGKVYKLIGSALKITDLKKVEGDLTNKNIELARLNEELEQFTYANQELNQFAYTASHQLQEPIRTISNYLNVIKEDYASLLDRNVLGYFNTIEDATKRMAELINSLLDYSRLGRNKKLVHVDCNQLIDKVISDLNYVISSSDANIVVSDMPVLSLYEIEVHQLFQNLIKNSIKFQKKGARPEIQIVSEKLDRKWQFSVTDNGIGIDPRHFERIFQIFQRLHTNEEEYEGKGIGLAYCKKIVQMHLGEIWVNSNPGKGSTFYFTIPVL